MSAYAAGEQRALKASLGTDPAQYLTFMLAGEAFAIGILAIREIIEYQGLTDVPLMPGFVRGVINLRGAVVPVMDLLARFGREPSPITKRTCIVIVDGMAEGQRQVFGLLVDAVNEVLEMAPADIEPAPAFGTRVGPEFIQGMGKVKGKFVILLNVSHVLTIGELGAHGAGNFAQHLDGAAALPA
jgi:purine-binding chemotaxis protein CheW